MQAHLTLEHSREERQARLEAIEAATGLRLDEHGGCRACHRPIDRGHAPSCPYQRLMTPRPPSAKVVPFREALAAYRITLIERAVQACGDQVTAARALKIHPRYVAYLLRRAYAHRRRAARARR